MANRGKRAKPVWSTSAIPGIIRQERSFGKMNFTAFYGSFVPDTIAVVVDEAYMHFVGDPNYESAIRYVKEGRNIIVARTFSKVYGMAGLRVGYAIARPNLIAKIKPYTVDYSITGMSADAVIAALGDQLNVGLSRQKLHEAMAQRRVFFDEMKKAKYEVTPSRAGFAVINVRTPVGPLIIREFAKRSSGRPRVSRHAYILRVYLAEQTKKRKSFTPPSTTSFVPSRRIVHSRHLYVLKR